MGDDIIRNRYGLPYGGLPYDALLDKLEETDPRLVDSVHGYDEFHDIEDDYTDYVRGEIVDWAPDEPFLESDQTRRDPGLSRSQLNLRYNGTRGSYAELPRHPEMFIGFTGNDPRGADNTPRFDMMRGFATSQASNLAVSFGDNDDNHVAERPWTGQAISYGMKEAHRRTRRNLKVFAVEKEGRPLARNVTLDPRAAPEIRAALMGAGGESFAGLTDAPRFAAGDYASAGDLYGAAPGAQGVHAGAAGARRHAKADSRLGGGAHQQLGGTRGPGRGVLGPGAVGGGKAALAADDQAWAGERKSAASYRQALGASMAVAARARRSGQADQAWGRAAEARGQPGAGLVPAADVARLYRLATEDQERRPATQVQDDAGAALPAAGLVPASNPRQAARAAQAHTSRTDHLANAEAIVAGLREGTAAGRRRVARMVVADGARVGPAGEAASQRPRTGWTPTDTGRAATKALATLHGPAAAGLAVHVYRGAPPVRPRAAADPGAADPKTWAASWETKPLGQSMSPAEWRPASEAQALLGTSDAETFGLNAEYAGTGGAGPVGPKRIRPGRGGHGWAADDDTESLSGGVDDSASVTS